MNNTLIAHAISNIWCSPDQDNQLILKPKRLTPPGGAFNEYKLLWSTYSLPVQGRRFHLFNLSQINPMLFNLFEETADVWNKISNACNVNNVVCDIYASSGVQLPKFQAWYTYSSDRSVILAIAQQSKIDFDFSLGDIYLRVYKNSYFQSPNITANEYVFVGGREIFTSDHIASVANEYSVKQALTGHTYGFINGIKAATLNASTIHIGDIVEYVYDSSIVKVVDFCLNDLRTFDSTLDSLGKYILHYSGADNGTIDFADDIDMFLLNSVSGKGIYFHKNHAYTLRNLSHRDYSVPVSYLLSYLPKIGNPNISNTYLRLHIRKSGWNRPLVKENNRIDRLYTLTDSQIKAAMIGTNSLVDVWKADKLESSKYPAVMGMKSKDITVDAVSRAYGYNAVSKLLASTPTVITGISTSVPILFTNSSVGFEYDSSGLLLGFYAHSGGDLYNRTNVACATVEMVSGIGGTILDDAIDVQNVTLLDNLDYRFYRTDSSPIPDDQRVWQDVTGTSDYTIIGTVAHWNTFIGQKTIVRSNKNFLVYSFNISASDGNIRFNILQNISGLQNGILVPMLVPMGELDIFMNGRCLIKDIDYFVNFPHVTIVNKEYLNGDGSGVQTFVIRSTGFCTNQIKMTPVLETGFVVNSKISVDSTYDVFTDKNVRFSVDGKLKLFNQMKFEEDSTSYILNDPTNGRPYSIRDLIAPLSDYIDQDTYSYRSDSVEIDRQVSSYVTERVQIAPALNVNPIVAKYKLFSPFLSKIIHDLNSGSLYDVKMEGQYSDDFIRAILTSYISLFSVDPLHPSNKIDSQYVSVHPHNLNTTVSLSASKYAFLNRVIGLYARGLTQASSYITVI